MTITECTYCGDIVKDENDIVGHFSDMLICSKCGTSPLRIKKLDEKKIDWYSGSDKTEVENYFNSDEFYYGTKKD